jgi:hypothetical protein
MAALGGFNEGFNSSAVKGTALAIYNAPRFH